MNGILSQLILIFTLGFTLNLQATIININNPPALQDYRLNYDEMRELADANRLSRRVFYVPSVGTNAKWFDAVKKGNLDQVKAMLNQGQNIEAKDDAVLGQTALGWAAFIGYEDIVKYLIEEGADLYATDRSDVDNVLKSAILGTNIRMVEYIYSLLADSVDINSRDKGDDETMLMIAASNERDATVAFLLNKGANANLVSQPLNQSALSYACERHNHKSIALLIKHGAINHKTGKASC